MKLLLFSWNFILDIISFDFSWLFLQKENPISITYLVFAEKFWVKEHLKQNIIVGCYFLFLKSPLATTFWRRQQQHGIPLSLTPKKRVLDFIHTPAHFWTPPPHLTIWSTCPTFWLREKNCFFPPLLSQVKASAWIVGARREGVCVCWVVETRRGGEDKRFSIQNICFMYVVYGYLFIVQPQTFN